MIVSVVLGVPLCPMGAAATDYSREVKPILTAFCTSCHGAIRQKAGLRLDTALFIRRGSKSGPVIAPGKSRESQLIERVTEADASLRMPPKSEGIALNAAQVAVLRAWIDEGAQAPPEPTPADPRSHWAYQPPVRPAIPRPVPTSWVGNPIDAFLAEGYQARGLRPSPPVDKDLWLRRAYFDLIGLPPTREERQAFLSDGDPSGEAKIVDRLLADPRHGERWARHWMDVWRYSDWYGLGDEVRYSHPHIWQWRDWIVTSVNTDKGYDRMVEEMLAGDELAPDDPLTLRATGFLVRNWDIFNRNAWLANTVEHTARAFLGVTVQCARCHDHKFDPISQVDYFRFRAFFEPYHVRIDRVPGQSDRTKAGLPRAFDDFLETPTYLFIRGDEAAADKSRPLGPAIPAVLGGEVKIAPISLPLEVSCPDKREFVVRETVQTMTSQAVQAYLFADAARNNAARANLLLVAANAADRKGAAKVKAAAAMPESLKAAQAAAAQAVEGLASADRAAHDAQTDLEQAQASLALADARLSALKAVLHVEQLEDRAGKSRDNSAWKQAARAVVAAQRRLGVIAASYNRLRALHDRDRASRTLDGLLAAGAAQKGDPLKEARAKAAAALVEARGRIATAEAEFAQAATAARAPLNTTYTPRSLEFPRAKTTYRDTPSNAPYRNTTSGRRRALAHWIVDRQNPLAARVAVNHVWARHFGEPLVTTMDDFGLRTPQPAQQKLLDWLAVEFMESSWSFKRLHRLIVSSDAYRMRSALAGPGDPNVAIDPDNRFVWRMNVRRMEGEIVRDSVLYLAGRLDAKLGGPDLPVASAEAGSRRTIYYRYASGESIPLLSAFDAANVSECYRRHETIVPQQALALTNSRMVLTGAGKIAAIIDHEVGAGPLARGAFVESAFARILGRVPTGAERTECVTGLARLAGALAREANGPAPSEARARAALVHVLLNHNDFVSIR
jgi:hypothetical protein